MSKKSSFIIFITIFLIGRAAFADTTYFSLLYGGYAAQVVEDDFCHLNETEQKGTSAIKWYYGSLTQSRLPMSCIVKMKDMANQYEFCSLTGVGFNTDRYLTECEVTQVNNDFIFKAEAWSENPENGESLPAVTCSFVCVKK